MKYQNENYPKQPSTWQNAIIGGIGVIIGVLVLYYLVIPAIVKIGAVTINCLLGEYFLCQ